MFADLEPSPVPAYQSLVEFGALWDHVALRHPRRVVEIGSLFGGTLWYWLQLPTVEEVVSIDLVTDWAPVADDVKAARALWPSWSPKLRIVEADSHDPATVELVGGPVDVLFVDGDHLHPEADLVWWPLVYPAGLLAFHDTVPNADRHEPAVVKLVGDLKRAHASVEWFEPDGVGITAFTF